MSHRLSRAAFVLIVASACSGPSSPALSDDLKQDLAKAGGTDMQLAGAAASRVDVVSSAERSRVNAPDRGSATIAHAARVERHASEASPRADPPARAVVPSRVEETTPDVAPPVEAAPANVPVAGRPGAPQPSTQREPRGGWRSPGDVIRRAPFPINP